MVLQVVSTNNNRFLVVKLWEIQTHQHPIPPPLIARQLFPRIFSRSSLTPNLDVFLFELLFSYLLAPPIN